MPDITVAVNGEFMSLPSGTLLPVLLSIRGMELNTAAVWINSVQPPFAAYSALELHDGDDIRLYPICIGG